MKHGKFFAVLAIFALMLTACDNSGGDPGGGGGGGGGFTAQTDNSIANDQATVGLVGDQVISNNSSVATAVIAGGKIVITSVGPGDTIITVTKTGNSYSATIRVTVAADGGISIDRVDPARGPRQISFTIKSGEYTIEGVKIQVGLSNAGGPYIVGSDSAYGEDTAIAAGGQKTFGPFTIEPGAGGDYSLNVTVLVDSLLAIYNFDSRTWSRFPKESYTLIVVRYGQYGTVYYGLRVEE
jgi:hypothetical protein